MKKKLTLSQQKSSNVEIRSSGMQNNVTVNGKPAPTCNVWGNEKLKRMKKV